MTDQKNQAQNATSNSAAPAGQQIPPEAKIENGETEKLKKELEEITELAKRTMADLVNLKRRQEEERKKIIFLANANLITELLPILDNLERARQHLPENTNKEWFTGIEIAISQFKKTLENFGLKPIETLGQKFNPELHEALIQTPGEKDQIIEELEKGYLLGDRVLRHAKVKVGNGEIASAAVTTENKSP